MAMNNDIRSHFISLLNAIDPERFTTLHEVWNFLAVSENMLLKILRTEDMLLEILGEESQDTALEGAGDPEFGMILYYLHQPHPDLMAFFEEGVEDVSIAAWRILTHTAKPSTQIMPAHFEGIFSKQAEAWWPIVGADGTIYDFSTYGGLNPKWALALINLSISWVTGKHPFGSTPYVASLPNNNDKITLGILGDWGTGNYGANNGPAAPIMAQLQALSCDYLFHLGDVYYAGTGHSPFIPANEEIDNFINLWPPSPGSKSAFALNSNHEMYPSGHGYFPLALGNPTFSHQNGTSYFGLTFGCWVILGLDSAYYASQTSLYMDGALGDEQIQWITTFGESIGGFQGKRVLVMTHHNGFAFDGKPSSTNQLWDEVCKALNRQPDVWYWGHIHNSIAYTNKSPAGGATRSCCIGGSAFPFAKAPGLLNDQGTMIDTVEYFAQSPNNINNKQVLNGFAVLELSLNGDLTETIYEQGNSMPAWTRTS